MSLDGSLKGKSTLERHRNVLRRAERIAFLEDGEKWTGVKILGFWIGKSGRITASWLRARRPPRLKDALRLAEGAVAAPGCHWSQGRCRTCGESGGPGS